MSAPARQHAPGLPTGSRSLTARQRAFVAAYARDAGRAGAAAAAREAGYNPRAAHIRGHRLLRTDYILAAIAHQPGGEAALEHLAETTRSPYIAALVQFVTAPDNGLRVVMNADRILVLIDRSTAAARRFALEHQPAEVSPDGGHDAPAGDPASAGDHDSPSGGKRSPDGEQAERASAVLSRFDGDTRDRSR